MIHLLDMVVAFYLESGDFNGYPLHKTDQQTRDSAADLLAAGRIEVISPADYMNPHIRPWPTRRSQEDQLRDIAGSATAEYAVCLYPTPATLKDRLDPDLFRDEPYRRRMAEGGTTLELAYFRFDVLEAYRNDPRFRFDFDDFGVRISISDEAYEDAEEPEDDKTSISHVGFAYDLSAFAPDDESTPLTRRVCAFLCDLSRLTPTHQQRWRTYEVPRNKNLQAHPVWFRAEMGNWPDGLGAFQRLMFELRSLNELHRNAFGVNLLKTTERPREFGWILRPSQHEFDAFIHQLDKLLSENLRHEALDGLSAPKVDENGKPMGTLNRLDRVLARHGNSETARREVLKPLRDVRAARQKPAHALRANITDKTFVRKQVQVLHDVTGSLVSLRQHWQSHPSNVGWQEPDHIANGKQYLF